MAAAADDWIANRMIGAARAAVARLAKPTVEKSEENRNVRVKVRKRQSGNSSHAQRSQERKSNVAEISPHVVREQAAMHYGNRDKHIHGVQTHPHRGGARRVRNISSWG